MKNIKVSVIVPIYNSEKYIRTCLESLIKQTLKPIEIILVNDGSTDRSIDHIFDLIEKYNFIRLIEIENSGAAEARNKGLALARGNYISFVDSDDFVHSTFLEKLYQEAENKKLDIICGSFEATYKNKVSKKMERNNELLRDGVQEGIVLFKKQIQLRNYIPMIWAYMYRREFLTKNSLWLSPKTIHEDEEFTPRVWNLAKRAKIIETFEYIYQREHEDSIIESRDESSVLDLENILISFMKYEENLSGKSKESFDYALLYVLDHYVYYGRMTKTLNKLLIKGIYSRLRRAKILTFKQKIKYFLIIKSTWLYFLVQNYQE